MATYSKKNVRFNYRRKSGVQKAAKRRRTDDAADANALAMFTDKSPTAREGNVALREQQSMWMKTLTELVPINMADGAFTTLATVQMNSVFEPVDTEAEQPRGHDTLMTLYKRCRVSKCAIEATVGIHYGMPVTGDGRPMYVGLTAHVAGEGPASLREALESPRTVYKVVFPSTRIFNGTFTDNYAEFSTRGTTVRGIFDCAEVFGNKKEYYSLDDTVNAGSNPATMMLCTFWACPSPSGDDADNWNLYPVVITNQQCRWFMPEKISAS